MKRPSPKDEEARLMRELVPVLAGFAIVFATLAVITWLWNVLR